MIRRIALIPFALAAILFAGTARAQSSKTTEEKAEEGNPHSVKNKDRPAGDTANAADGAGHESADSAQEGNPHDRKNKDRKAGKHGNKAAFERAEKADPNSVKNAHRGEKKGAHAHADADADADAAKAADTGAGK